MEKEATPSRAEIKGRDFLGRGVVSHGPSKVRCPGRGLLTPALSPGGRGGRVFLPLLPGERAGVRGPLAREVTSGRSWAVPGASRQSRGDLIGSIDSASRQ